jgi:hypothetical protein
MREAQGWITEIRARDVRNQIVDLTLCLETSDHLRALIGAQGGALFPSAPVVEAILGNGAACVCCAAQTRVASAHRFEAQRLRSENEALRRENSNLRVERDSRSVTP